MHRSTTDAQEAWPGGLLEEMTSLQSSLSMLPDDALPESAQTIAASVPEVCPAQCCPSPDTRDDVMPGVWACRMPAESLATGWHTSACMSAV